MRQMSRSFISSVTGQNGDKPKRRQSEWRQSKTVTTGLVKTATEKNPKRQNGDKKLIQGSNDEKKKHVVYNLYMRHVVVLQILIVYTCLMFT